MLMGGINHQHNYIRVVYDIAVLTLIPTTTLIRALLTCHHDWGVLERVVTEDPDHQVSISPFFQQCSYSEENNVINDGNYSVNNYSVIIPITQC
jgi:hypothetical protein